MRDVTYGLRLMRKHPWTTAVAVLAIALGVGANTAMFTVVNAVLLQLPFQDPERLVAVRGERAGRMSVAIPMSQLRLWAERVAALEAVAGYTMLSPVMTGTVHEGAEVAGAAQTGSAPAGAGLASPAAVPDRLRLECVSAGLFEMLGVAPARGRTFTREEDSGAGAPVIVVSHGFWAGRLARDPRGVGQVLTLDGTPVTVIGVMPEAFDGPRALRRLDGWMPLTSCLTARRAERLAAGTISVYARLRPDVSARVAEAQMDAAIEPAAPGEAPFRVRLFPLTDDITGEVRKPLLALLGAAGFVLLIACANVANLLLGRADARRRELAVRAALGGSRARLVRQLLTESLLLALCGGAAGLLIAHWSLQTLISVMPGSIRRIDHIALDSTVLTACLALSAATTFLFGLLPAVHASRVDLGSTLKDSGLLATPSRRTLRGALIVVEVALSVALLTGAGLLMKTFLHLRPVDPGFDAGGKLAATIVLPRARYADGPAQAAFLDQLRARLLARPGVDAAVAASYLPLSGFVTSVELRQDGAGGPLLEVSAPHVTPDGAGDAGRRVRPGPGLAHHTVPDRLAGRDEPPRSIDVRRRDRGDGPDLPAGHLPRGTPRRERRSPHRLALVTCIRSDHHQPGTRMMTHVVEVRAHLEDTYQDVYTPVALRALAALAPLDADRRAVMRARIDRRATRAKEGRRLEFLDPHARIPRTEITVQEARDGAFTGSEIPADLRRQWIQGTGPAARPNAPVTTSLRNVAYALLSGADGWMFDGEDALGQVSTMSLDNQRNLKLAIHDDQQFLDVAAQVAGEMNHWATGFFGRPIIDDWRRQLTFTTKIFRARGLHLDDRHLRHADGSGFSASIADATLYVVNNHERLRRNGSSVVLYLPKIQTAEEAALWNDILSALERHLGLPVGTVKAYVLVEQIEACFQLMEIRAALAPRFVGFNTGRWDYINSVSDALAWDRAFINPNIDAITMTYGYMQRYEDRVRRAVCTPDRLGQFALWQGGMEPNIPVGSEAGVAAGMARAVGGAEREQREGASGKWVAHWKMVHIVRPVWERVGEDNQLGRQFPRLTYTPDDADGLNVLQPAPRTVRGARDLLSVALQYGNAFGQGLQAAALKPADFFGNDDVLYLMEDMATGEIRLSILWEWLHKGATLTADDEIGVKAGDTFTPELFTRLLAEEYEKLQQATNRDVYDVSKHTTLPIAHDIVETYVLSDVKLPWYIDLLNVNLDNHDRAEGQRRIARLVEAFRKDGTRITENQDFK